MPVSTPYIQPVRPVVTYPKTEDPYYQHELRRFKASILAPTETAARKEFQQQISEAVQKVPVYSEELDVSGVMPVNLLPPEQQRQVKEWATAQTIKFETQVIPEWRQEALSQFEKTWQPPSIAERILHVGESKQVYPRLTQTGLLSPPKTTFETSKPLGAVAGAVAYPEMLSYSAITLLGGKPPTRPTPSLQEGGIEYRKGYVTAYVASTYLAGELIAKTPIGKAEAWAIQKVSKTAPAQWLGFQFRQHAPEWLLQMIYGKQVAQAVAIERQWSWATPVAKGTAGMVEQTYGMPFYRAESLQVAMPTKEWARIGAVEWLAKQKSIEASFSWTAPALGLQSGKMVTVLTPSREYFETQQSIIMDMPLQAKPQKWYIETRGYTKTPWDVTLRRALNGGEGLLSAPTQIQILTYPPTFKGTPSPLTFFKAPTRLYPKTYDFAIPKGTRIGLTPKQFTVPFVAPLLKPQQIDIPTISPISSQETLSIPVQTQSLKQIQKQTQKLTQITTQKLITPQISISTSTTKPPPFKTPTIPPWIPRQDQLFKRKRGKRGKEDLFGLFGRQKRLWPVATPKQVLKKVLE